MQYSIDAIENSKVDAVNQLLDLVNSEDFIKDVRVDKYTYDFEYEVKTNVLVENEFCIDELNEIIFPILSLIDQNTEKTLLEIVATIAKHSIKVAGSIYSSPIIWRNEELPAGLDIAYALALYNVDNCIDLGNLLLATDADHDVYQVDIINSLIDKYGIIHQTLYLLGSYSLHGSSGNDNVMEQIRSSQNGSQIKKMSSILIDRLEQINKMKKGKYQKQVDRISNALNE